MDSLRIDNGLRKIDVNDAGECIEFSIVDNNFFRAFFDMLQWFETQENREDIKELKDKEDEIVSDDGKKIHYDSINKVLDVREKISDEASEKIEMIFGEGSCRKVFGKVKPDMYMISDFLYAIAPFIDKYYKERNQAINKKYSKNRKGAKS